MGVRRQQNYTGFYEIKREREKESWGAGEGGRAQKGNQQEREVSFSIIQTNGSQTVSPPNGVWSLLQMQGLFEAMQRFLTKLFQKTFWKLLRNTQQNNNHFFLSHFL